MLSGLMMITRQALTRLRGCLIGLVALVAAAAGTASCDSVPLLAPSGSTITLTASSNAIPANGTAQLVAYVLEQAGTPPHPGTQVIFTTNLGIVEPAEATTDVNGRAMATFRGNGQNGTATINAVSGAASTAAGGGGTTTTPGGTTTPTNSSTGPVRISVGTGAVGRITLSANPTTISANGGSAVVTANVVDLNGNALPGAPVSFATSAGVLSGSLVNTDSNGNAQTTLTTSVEAIVTANVGASGSGSGTGGGGTGGGSTGGSTSGQTSATVTVKVNPLPTVSISATGTAFQAGTPVVFTISAQPGTGSTSQIREVVVNFGDGTITNLGGVSGSSMTVQHKYDEGDTYTVTVRVTDTLGTVVNAATTIVVLDLPPLNVSISKASQPAGANTNYTLTATVTPPSVIVANYLWKVDGFQQQSGGSNQLLLTLPTGTNHTVTVDVTTTTGALASAAVFLP
jgi:hypothetical protein